MPQKLNYWEHSTPHRQGCSSLLRWRGSLRWVPLRLSNLCAIEKLQLSPQVPWASSTWLSSYVHPSPAFTQPQCARSLRAAAWRSSTTRSSPPCSPSRSTTASRRCTSWPRCAPSGCPSSRAGALNTTGRTWRRLRVGSRCTFTDLSSGWTRCWRRWEAPRTSSPPSPSCPRTLCLISNASTIETKYQLWFVPFETFASYKVIFSPSLNAIKQFKCK